MIRALRSSLRLVMGAVVSAALGLAIGLVIVLLVPRLVGGGVLTVRSGSMTPAIRTGDVVLVEKIRPLDIKIGDIVTFRSADEGSRLITHRVRQVRVRGTRVFVTTKGDANNTVERWSINAGGTLGRVRFRLPLIGYGGAWVEGRDGRLVLVGLPILMLAALEIVRVWRRPAPGAQGEARS